MSRADVSGIRSAPGVAGVGPLLAAERKPGRRRRPRLDQSGRVERRITVPGSGRTLAQSYFSELARIVRQMNAIIEATVTSQLPGLVSTANAEFARDSARNDQIEDQLEFLFEEVQAQLGRVFSQAQIEAIVMGHGLEVSRFNRRQVARQFKQSIGVDVFADSPALQGRLTQFGKKNARLIRKLSREHLDRVQSLVSEGLASGRTSAQIARDISKAKGIPRRRALLIARDQTAKLNGQIAVDRMRTNGVKKGIWRTVGDERVRDEHAAREGQEFDLARGIEGELPGQPVNCRCVTEPVFSSPSSSPSSF